MSDFVQPSERSIELPLGCKDLMDVEGVHHWKAACRPDWFTSPKEDRLAYIEGYLARQLELAGKSALVAVSRHLDRGHVFIHADDDLSANVVFAKWNSAEQEQMLRGVFDEAGIPAVADPVGRWKAKKSLKYLLPTDSCVAVRLIGEVFRNGYGLTEHSLIGTWNYERKSA